MKKKNIRNNGLGRVKIIRPFHAPPSSGLAPYPALRLLAAVVAGILAGTRHPFSLDIWIVAFSVALALTAIGLALSFRRPSGRFPDPFTTIFYLALVFTAFGAYGDFLFNHVPRRGLLEQAGSSVVVSGRIDGRPAVSSRGTAFVLDISSIYADGAEKAMHDRASVYVRNPKAEVLPLRDGDLVLVRGAVGIPGGPANRGEFDPHRRARLQRVSASIYCQGPWQILHEGGRDIGTFDRLFVDPVHDYVINTLGEFFPDGPRRQFMAGVLVGQRAGLDEDLGEAFQRTGTAHILAVSGLHVGLIVLVVNLLLHRLRVTGPGRWAVFLLTAFVLIIYGSVAGGAPSVRRASLMTMALLGGGVSGRKAFPLNSLALADVLLLSFDPLELFNPGFQMTNGAVAGILLLLPRLHPPAGSGGGLLAGGWHALRGSLSLTVAATVGVAPVIAMYFGSVSIVGIAANLPVVFFSSLMVYALLPMLLVNLVSGPVASLFASSAVYFSGLAIDAARWFSAVPFASVPFSVGAAGALVWYALLAALLLFMMSARRAGAVLLLLAVADILVWVPLFSGGLAGPPSAVTVNLGRDVAMLFSSGRESVMIDAGRDERAFGRIANQAQGYGLPPLSAAVAFALKDSVISRVPVARLMLSADSVLSLPSIVAFRPAGGVLRVWSRHRSLLMVKGLEGLFTSGGALRRADIAVVRLHRFRRKDEAALSGWIGDVAPGSCILIPGPLMPKKERGFLGSFARRNPRVQIRSKTAQAVFR
ncbi:ComEC/Rec2 family competence protein [Pelodictyon luteolum]|uniref:ComEC/Rec2-related protein n=1 Tax=Chlorobium luteolum (strain DSM 273 / BCRC 81028 / 2530) TaxID=319225 RepID=Q3B376_CHLL3|nr:ComEC/Rec2 family competence protein [Pelodictyon luteolum]ABB24205.1 ComEC/Rec2-related protein [Pelodictyon luteolum DSM 273]